MPTTIPPQVTGTGTGTVVDLQVSESAAKLASQLNSLHLFVDAAETLLTVYDLSPADFQRHSKKIIALIEIARRTLADAKISPYFLCAGKAASTAFKAAYIDLLHMIYDRFDDIDPACRGRALDLLAPLHAQSITVIRAGGDSDTGISMRGMSLRPNPLVSGDYRRERVHSVTSERQREMRSRTMPPPDAWSLRRRSNPLAGLRPKVRMARTRSQPRASMVYKDDEPPRPRSIRCTDSSEEDQENARPLPTQLFKPLRQRFGIYCTKNTSMYR